MFNASGRSFEQDNLVPAGCRNRMMRGDAKKAGKVALYPRDLIQDRQLA